MTQQNIHLTKHDWFSIYTFSNDWLGADIMRGVAWEPHIVKFLNNNLKYYHTFFDVGSNYGWHSIVSSKLCKCVHSFEPQTVMYEIQNKSIKYNNIDNIVQHHVAVGDKDDYIQMTAIDYSIDSLNIGDLSVGANGEMVISKRLDSFDFTSVDFIKIDVQGYEKFVIQGSLNLIQKCKPTLIVEFENHQMNKFGYNSDNLFDIIKQLDYEIYFLEHTYPSDHVCVHKSKIKEFEEINNISPLVQSNNLNRNLENNVTKRILT